MDFGTMHGVALLDEAESVAVNGGDIGAGGNVTILKLKLYFSQHKESARARNKATLVQAVVNSPGATSDQMNEQTATALA